MLPVAPRCVQTPHRARKHMPASHSVRLLLIPAGGTIHPLHGHRHHLAHQQSQQPAWAKLWFTWVSPLMANGARRQLQARDLLPLDHDMQPSACSERLWHEWTQVRPHL